MRVNASSFASPQFSVFSPDQLQELFLAALRLLENTGIDLYHEEARSILANAGARVDGLRVRLPASLVSRAIAEAPATFTVGSWEGDPRKDITIAPGRPHYGPGPTCPNFRDPHTNARRLFLRRDAAAVAKTCDALSHIDFVQSLGTISDVTPRLADIYEFADMIAETGKPIVAWSYTVHGCRDIHQMAVSLAGSEDAFIRRPNYLFYCEPLSPLTCNQEAMDKLVYCARRHIPVVFTPCPIGGGTAPATGAGEIVQAAAECWIGLVVSQLLSPGTPFVMGAVVSIMDMRRMVLSYGAPELSLLQAGLTELARHVGLPVWSTAGCTDAKAADEQAAIEGSLSILFAGLSGADLIHDVGFIESAMTGSLDQLAMMDEAIGMVRRILGGVRVTPETLATDVIHRVGPGGHFLSDDHTLEHFRAEFWFPTLMDRRRWSDWRGDGGATMGDRTHRRVGEILRRHPAPSLPTAARNRINAILEEAEERGTA